MVNPKQANLPSHNTSLGALNIAIRSVVETRIKCLMFRNSTLSYFKRSMNLIQIQKAQNPCSKVQRLALNKAYL